MGERGRSMARVRSSAFVLVVVVTLAGLVAGACGSEAPGGDDGSAPGATAPEDTTATSAGPMDSADLPEGFPSRVVLVIGGVVAAEQLLVVVDVASGEQRVLADRDALAAQVSMPRVDLASIGPPLLSADGTEVTFPFGYETSTLFAVPVDGSAAPRPVADLDDDDRYAPSPDGRWRPVFDADRLRLVPADGSPSPRPAGVTLPYPPAEVAWSPDGTLLAVVPHFERSAPPPPVGYSVDPAGALRPTEAPQVSGGATAGLRSGPMWFDAEGRLHVVPDGFRPEGEAQVVLTSLAVDRTHRFVLGLAVEWPESMDGMPSNAGETTARIVWWDAADDAPDPHPLDIDADLPSPYSSDGGVAAAW